MKRTQQNKKLNQAINIDKSNYINMAKEKSYRNAKRYMMEYKMRTAYPIPIQMNHQKYIQQNTRNTQPHPAHERSHAKHNPADTFYHSEERIDKNKRTIKPVHQQNQIEVNYSERAVPVPTIATTNKSSCCTIL